MRTLTLLFLLVSLGCSAQNWYFYTAHEMNNIDGRVGVPAGWELHNGAAVARCALIDSTCFIGCDGYLRMESRRLPMTVDNTFGTQVEYATFACRSASPESPDHWCSFTENMRIEVCARRSPHIGFNDAIWFMGYNKRPWPDRGEIDLMENPKRTVNNRIHFTLHSKNCRSITASTEVADMTDWNVYWLEWLPDEIRGGVNDCQYFKHRKGADGCDDWPWSDPEYFYMIFSSGLSTDPERWPGAIDSDTWTTAPYMDIDYVRVYVNDDYIGPKAPAKKFY